MFSIHAIYLRIIQQLFFFFSLLLCELVESKRNRAWEVEDGKFHNIILSGCLMLKCTHRLFSSNLHSTSHSRDSIIHFIVYDERIGALFLSLGYIFFFFHYLKKKYAEKLPTLNSTCIKYLCANGCDIELVWRGYFELTIVSTVTGLPGTNQSIRFSMKRIINGQRQMRYVKC